MKKMLFCLTLAGVLPALLSCSANAGDGNTTMVKKAFEQRFTDRKVLAVRTTPVKGIYEVDVQGNQVVYVDPKVDYVFVGDLVDVKSGQSLTEARRSELNRVAWNTLPLADAIKEVRGNGERKLAVFTDPDCPYCKRLERDSLAGVSNVTIYTFLFPLAQLHPDAVRKSQQIWCARNPVQAWNDWVLKEQQPAGKGDCATPIKRNLALGAKLGINATPTLIFGNGRMVAGALPPEQLEQALNEK